MLKQQIILTRHLPHPHEHRRPHRAMRIRPKPIDNIMIIPYIHHGYTRRRHSEQALREPPHIPFEINFLQLVLHLRGEGCMPLTHAVPRLCPPPEMPGVQTACVVVDLVAPAEHGVEGIATVVLTQDIPPERIRAGVSQGVHGEGEAVAAVVHEVHCLVEGGDVEGLGGGGVVDAVKVLGGRAGVLGDGEDEAPEGVAAFGVEVCCCYRF